MEALVKINPNKEQIFRQFLALMKDLEVIESAQIRQIDTKADSSFSQNFGSYEDSWSEKSDKSTKELAQQYRDLVD